MKHSKGISIRKICIWLLPWYPILQMYYIGSLSLGFLIFTPMLLALVGNKRRMVKDNTLVILFAVLVGVELVQFVLPYTTVSVIRNNIIMQTISILSIICVTNMVKYEELLRPYIVACLIMIAGLFYQVFQLFVLHVFIEGPIILFPSLIAENNIYTGDTIVRPMSFFQEPQAYCTYIMIFVIFMIEQKRFILAGIASISVLLSTSTEGLVLCALVWLIFIFFSESSIWTKGLILGGAILLVGYYMSSELFSVGFDKATNTNYEENVRITNGFNILKEMDAGGWLFGMGTAPNAFFNAISSKYSGEPGSLPYFSSATGAFITHGIFVGIAYWIFLLRKIRLKYKPVFMLGVILVVVPFAQTCFWSSTFVYMFSLYYILNHYCERTFIGTTSKYKMLRK